MDPFRVAVIGCGAISGNHFHALEKLKSARLTAVCDIDPEKLKNAAEAQHAKAYDDWRELLADPEIDAVHICTPHCLHRDMAVAALSAGKHVLCEKPMGLNAAEAEAMAEAAAKAEAQLTVCFQNRYNAASRRMKELISSGSLGGFTGGSAFVVWNRTDTAQKDYRADGWRGKWASEGGSALINQAIHTLDLARWLTGDLSVVSGAMLAHRLGDTIETEDTCDLLMQDKAGHRMLFYCTNCGGSNLPVQLHLNFEKGELHLNGSILTIRTAGSTEVEDHSSEVLVGKDYWGSGHGPLIEDFYRRLAMGQPPAITAEDALRTMRLMDEAYQAHATERRRL